LGQGVLKNIVKYRSISVRGALFIVWIKSPMRNRKKQGIMVAISNDAKAKERLNVTGIIAIMGGTKDVRSESEQKV